MDFKELDRQIAEERQIYKGKIEGRRRKWANHGGGNVRSMCVWGK